MTKKEFLDTYIFKSLTDLNDGFDADGIKYFSKTEFEVILNRVEDHGLKIYGIELWKDREYCDTETFEFHHPNIAQADDPKWYRHAFNEIAIEESNLMFAASYGVPDTLLR